MPTTDLNDSEASGAFVTLDGERYYSIRNVDKIPPFFMSLVSDNDHWTFVASNGGLTAGRVSPDTALFPYVTVDKIYDSTPNTGCKTLLRAEMHGKCHHWEPFNKEHDGRYATTRNLYKSVVGNKLLFEEINHDLHLTFRYSWASSDAYGLVRQVQLANHGTTDCRIELVDGLQNLLPAGTPRAVQTSSSYLVDAYKWSELDEPTGLAQFTLFSGISDRAEPRESLRATTVFCLGLEGRQVLLSTEQLEHFRSGGSVVQETCKRGVRGAYLVSASLGLTANASRRWQLVANVEQTQSNAVALIHQLSDPKAVADSIARSVAKGSDTLARIVATGDGLQKTAEENVSAHHYANVMFNILRGGIVNNQYLIPSSNFSRHIAFFNRRIYDRHRTLLASLPDEIGYGELRAKIEQTGDAQLLRVSREFLPITFGRRHGDPSRPWNHFSIKLIDDQGHRPLTYQGNWRDIFQNWEALLLSYPELIEDVIAKFVNASTVEGYNPYRISRRGHRLGSGGPGRSVELHRLLGRSPDHLSAEATGDCRNSFTRAGSAGSCTSDSSVTPTCRTGSSRLRAVLANPPRVRSTTTRTWQCALRSAWSSWVPTASCCWTPMARCTRSPCSRSCSCHCSASLPTWWWTAASG